MRTHAAGGCGSEDGPQDDAATAAAASGSDVSRATGCAKEVTVLLWPDGHPAVPGISFPSPPMHRGREELGAPLRAGFLRALGSAGAVDVRSRATRCAP